MKKHIALKNSETLKYILQKIGVSGVQILLTMEGLESKKDENHWLNLVVSSFIFKLTTSSL